MTVHPHDYAIFAGVTGLASTMFGLSGSYFTSGIRGSLQGASASSVLYLLAKVALPPLNESLLHRSLRITAVLTTTSALPILASQPFDYFDGTMSSYNVLKDVATGICGTIGTAAGLFIAEKYLYRKFN